MMFPHDGFGWGWNGSLSFVLLLAVLALTVWLVAGLARSAPAGPPPPPVGRPTAVPPTDPEPAVRAAERAATERAVWDRAEEILAERYARGEIDDDEYGRRLATLRTGRGAPAAGAR